MIPELTLQSQCRPVAIRASDPLALHCGHCGRTKAACDADVKGCGSTPAVSLPSAPVVEKAPASLLTDWCYECGWAKAYCKGH